MKICVCLLSILFVSSISITQNTHRFYYSIGVKAFSNANVEHSFAASLIGVRVLQVKKIEVLTQIMGDVGLNGGFLGGGLRMTYGNFYLPKKLFGFVEANRLLDGDSFIDSKTFLSGGIGWVINENTHFDIGVGTYLPKSVVILRWYKTFGRKSTRNDKLHKPKSGKEIACPPHLKHQ